MSFGQRDGGKRIFTRTLIRCSLLKLTLTGPDHATLAQQTPADLSAKMASLHSRIQKERKILEGFQAMRAATSNQDVIRTCEAKMRESAKTIGWFEQSLRELEVRAQDGTGRSSSPANSLEQSRMRNLPPPPPGAAPSYQQQQHGYVQDQHQRSSIAQDVVKPKVNYTSLGGSPSSVVASEGRSCRS